MSGRMRYLVTGGAGFIGSNIVSELCRDPGASVIVCDRLGDATSGKWRHLLGQPIADWIPPEGLWPWLEAQGDRLDAIIHMGAVSSTTETDIDLILRENFALSRDLFRWCARAGKRLVYASSAATYGAGELGFDDPTDLDHLAALRPLNPYGWSKALFDLFCVREASAGCAPPHWTGLKFFNVFGPREDHKGAMRSVVAQIWPSLAAGETVRLFKSEHPDYADGGQMRDFVYVRDVARCVAWLARGAGPNGVFNFGSGHARSFADLAHAAFAAAGRPPRITYVPLPEALRGRYQYFTEARMDRLRAAGWREPATPLEEAVADYVRSYLAKAGAAG
ncbi:MAG: ADP-glyceromanno-heptose 6-epimerase [Alphaproteobacteria bacterium]|nr:ADP-glyceromanno-heptose 6-epimerase [Alphaproteobacteria bacterium]